MSRVRPTGPVVVTASVPIPPSRIVRLPGRYAHSFASMPESWREVAIDEPTVQRVVYPRLVNEDALFVREARRIRDLDDGIIWDDDR